VNLNQVKKLYGNLAPAERFAAILAAALRGDETERLALVNSAPRRRYETGDYTPLAEAWERLAHLHAETQLYFALCIHVLLRYPESMGEEAEDTLIQGACIYLANAEAWRQACQAHGLDPAGMLLDMPGCGTHDPEAPIMAQTNALDMVQRTCAAICPEGPDPAVVAELVQALEAALVRAA